MSKKKNFKNPTSIEKRKGVELLVGQTQKDEKENLPVEDEYVTSNVRVRKDLRQQIYMLRAKTGKTLQATYTDIFEYWFENNPL
jgi:AAA15 family ATPase/GTPase